MIKPVITYNIDETIVCCSVMGLFLYPCHRLVEWSQYVSDHAVYFMYSCRYIQPIYGIDVTNSWLYDTNYPIIQQAVEVRMWISWNYMQTFWWIIKWFRHTHKYQQLQNGKHVICYALKTSDHKQNTRWYSTHWYMYLVTLMYVNELGH